MIATNTAESIWWSLSIDQRIHYERCIHAIVYTHYHGNSYQVRQLIYAAQDAGYTRNALVKAIVWRLFQEIDDNDY